MNRLVEELAPVNLKTRLTEVAARRAENVLEELPKTMKWKLFLLVSSASLPIFLAGLLHVLFRWLVG
jgi:hypothetical protein